MQYAMNGLCTVRCIFAAMFGVSPSGASSRYRWRGVSFAAEARPKGPLRLRRRASRATATAPRAAHQSKQGLAASVHPAAYPTTRDT